MGILSRLSRLLRAEVSYRTGRRAPPPVLQPGVSGGGHAPPEEPEIPPKVADAYRTLGLTPGTRREGCREAWIELLKLHHPDHHQGADEAALARAKERTLEIQAAWEVLDHWLVDQ